MSYGTVIHAPEVPIVEEWTWETDLAVSFNGTEDRTPLLRYPRRIFTGKFVFTEAADLRRHLAMMTKRYVAEFLFPLFQYQVKLKAKVSAGLFAVIVNGRRGNFRVGSRALIVEGSKFEEVDVFAVGPTSLEFTTPLVNSYSSRAIVCPLATVYSNSNANVTRRAADNSGESSFTFIERVPTVPFVPPLNEVAIDTFDGLPVLPFVPLGTGFESAVATGLQPVDYLGIADLVSPWQFEQWVHNLTFKAELTGSAYELEWWQAFADLIQGSANPFLFPTNRADMGIVTPAESGGSVVTVYSDEYTQHYAGRDTFDRIFISSDVGRHFAKIIGLSSVDGNDRLTFDPPLPGLKLHEEEVAINLSWWQSSFHPSNNDHARMRIAFFDEAGTNIKEVAAAMTGTANLVWTQRFLNTTQPVGTAYIELYMDFDRQEGTSNDGYIDDVGLIADGVPVLVLNPGAEEGLEHWTTLLGGLSFRGSGPAPHSGGSYFFGGNNPYTTASQRIAPQNWQANQKVGFLLKVRNENDKLVLNHFGLSTEVSIAIRTVE